MTVQQQKLLRWTENDFSFMMSINSQTLGVDMGISGTTHSDFVTSASCDPDT